jgi:DNA-binding NtrC family response regulator
MANQTQTLFIVQDNAETSLNLKQFIEKRFNTFFNIQTFHNAVEALEKIDKNTTILLLDYDYFGDKGNKIVNFVNDINPETKVIILSNNEEIGNAIDAHRNRKNIHIVKDIKAPNRLFLTLTDVAYYPVRLLISGFGFGEMAALFVSCALYVAVFAFILYWILKH